VSDKDDQFVKMTNMMDPAYASGRWQDGIGRIYFITRKPAIGTSVSVVCTGGQGVSIPAGSLAEALDGNIYTCVDGGTIDQTGTVSLSFVCNTLGPIPCPAGTLSKIYRTVLGWDSITNPTDGALGQNVESRAEFEERRAQSVAANARNTNESVLGAVLDIADVLDAYVIDNDQSSTVSKGGVSLDANCIYVAVSGGTDIDVATAVWRKKPPGIPYYSGSNTTVTVTGSADLYTPPLPTWTVKLFRPPPLPILFAVNMLTNQQVPSDAAAQIQNAIILAFAGADGGTRARIGSTLIALRYASAVVALGAWAQLLSIQIGSYNNPVVSFTGSIAGTTLTATGQSPAASLAIGQTISDGGAAPAVLPGTTILSGSGGTWTLSKSQTVASRAMFGMLANRNSVVTNINQRPTISAGNIAVTFT
jgi:hypothetical protein